MDMGRVMNPREERGQSENRKLEIKVMPCFCAGCCYMIRYRWWELR